jgi:hypothetical protein
VKYLAVCCVRALGTHQLLHLIERFRQLGVLFTEVLNLGTQEKNENKITLFGKLDCNQFSPPKHASNARRLIMTIHPQQRSPR